MAEGRDDDDGLPKVVVADPNTLDATGKKQMVRVSLYVCALLQCIVLPFSMTLTRCTQVLTINMGDLEHLVAEVRKHRGSSAPHHPLHRSSDLYQCATLPEQIQCLEEQAKKRQRKS